MSNLWNSWRSARPTSTGNRLSELISWSLLKKNPSGALIWGIFGAALSMNAYFVIHFLQKKEYQVMLIALFKYFLLIFDRFRWTTKDACGTNVLKCSRIQLRWNCTIHLTKAYRNRLVSRWSMFTGKCAKLKTERSQPRTRR